MQGASRNGCLCLHRVGPAGCVVAPKVDDASEGDAWPASKTRRSTCARFVGSTVNPPAGPRTASSRRRARHPGRPREEPRRGRGRRLRLPRRPATGRALRRAAPRSASAAIRARRPLPEAARFGPKRHGSGGGAPAIRGTPRGGPRRRTATHPRSTPRPLPIGPRRGSTPRAVRLHERPTGPTGSASRAVSVVRAGPRGGLQELEAAASSRAGWMP